MTTITFKDVYQLPLHIDVSHLYIFSSNDVMVFNTLYDYIPDELVEDIVDIINGKSDKKYTNVSYKDDCIYINYNPVSMIRGWGYLTGTGGLNLTFEEAAKIQDDFCNWVVAILKGISC